MGLADFSDLALHCPVFSSLHSVFSKGELILEHEGGGGVSPTGFHFFSQSRAEIYSKARAKGETPVSWFGQLCIPRQARDSWKEQTSRDTASNSLLGMEWKLNEYM